ncbi:MAG TPA: hypothetical protein EYQ74_14245, partial [Planctomycetes bacterium]|nr:hypothetical protein [Planctomycetota bacterium]
MKQLNITIHPFSALAGMALLGLVWVTAGAMPLQGSSSTRDVSAIENVNEPHPRDYVQIFEGAPYTVPQGKLLVIKQVGNVRPAGGQSYSRIELSVNGLTIAITDTATFLA